MSGVIAKEFARAGAGDKTGVYSLMYQVTTMTMAAGVTVAASEVLPAGAILRAVNSEVATAFSGSPTNINFSVGSAAAGAQVVAAVDLKAQGHTANTIVAGFDPVAFAATATTTIYYTLAAVGGTNPAGTMTVITSYLMPAP